MFRRHREPDQPDRVVVIGLGRFGTSVSRTLMKLGYEVLAIDIAERPVADASNFVTLAAQGDGTDEELLRSLHVEESDVGIVAQGENLEASVLSTLLLKQLGVPWVISKATSKLHGDVLHRIGANRIVFPETDAGNRLGHSLAVRSINDYISLTATAGVAKMHAPARLVGHSVGEIYEKKGLALSILLIRRDDHLIMAPQSTETIRAEDEIVVAGTDRAINRFNTFANEVKPA